MRISISGATHSDGGFLYYELRTRQLLLMILALKELQVFMMSSIILIRDVTFLSLGRWLLDDALPHNVIFEKKTTAQIIIERKWKYESISGVDWHSSYQPPFILKCGSLAAEWSFSRSFTVNFVFIDIFFSFFPSPWINSLCKKYKYTVTFLDRIWNQKKK